MTTPEKRITRALEIARRGVIDQMVRALTGFLHAILIWERGDSITRLTVKDGVVREEGIDL